MDPVRELSQKFPPQGILGYLNYSDGRPDPKFQRAMNDTYSFLAEQGDPAPWVTLPRWLLEQLKQLQASGSSAFKEIVQAENVILIAFEKLLAGYRAFHRDLLGHQADATLFTPFFLARVCEVVLQQGSPWTQESRIVVGAMNQLNDYVGHRPIAILETRPQTTLYPHEKLRPVPLYLKGVGVGHGRYQSIIQQALTILEKTEPHLLTAADFELSRMEEMAFDPRAYDHSHPVNRRPNYLFGEWDPHHIDGHGNYTRFVVRQNVLDALLDASLSIRSVGSGSIDRVYESAAVLAGTILMASGISGSGPTVHDSDTKLANLIPRIARYRDQFYQHLVQTIPGDLGDSLREEAKRVRQPFGGIRQQLNLELARQRAFQLQEGHLAIIFAELGYAKASRDRAKRIPAASVRIQSEIRLRQTSAEVAISQKRGMSAVQLLPEIESLMKRGIDCGALADPWNILGYQGLYPLFQSREDSVADTRNEELIDIVSRQFDLYSHLLADAASHGDAHLQETLAEGVRQLAEWWDKYATYEVSDVPRLHGGERAEAALHVANSLAQWSAKFSQSSGPSGGSEVLFWREHRDGFTSPAAFAQVVEALLTQQQWQASLALLVAWLAETETIALEEGEASFPWLIMRWIEGVTDLEDAELKTRLIQRAFELLEVNGEHLWGVPEFSSLGGSESDSEEGRYESAYEGMSFKDSTDDGEEGSVIGNDAFDSFTLEAHSKPIEQRLQFLDTIAQLWQRCLAAGIDPITKPPAPSSGVALRPHRPTTNWLATARSWQDGLVNFMDLLHDLPIPAPGAGVDEVIEFDRRRHLKDHLLDATIDTAIEISKAVRALASIHDDDSDHFSTSWEPEAILVEQAMATHDPNEVRAELPGLMKAIEREQSLFVPLSDGGDPRQIFQARSLLALVDELLEGLPRLGLIRETYQLLRQAKTMEQNGPAEGRKVSEFDRLFKIGLRSTVDTLLQQAERWDRDLAQPENIPGIALPVPILSTFGKILSTISNEFLRLWVDHSNTLRLAAVEGIGDQREWQTFREFIRNYGRELFTPDFMAFGNLRGILHQGIGTWLDSLTERGDDTRPEKLLNDLETRKLSRQRVTHYLETLMLAVAENYEEYRDYNTTTTQSDYGENLYVLMEFLRLKVQYDRYAWRMKPLVLAHEVLCRRGQIDIAQSWLERISEESGELSETLLAELTQLEQTHAIRLRTIRDRLEERFLHPLQVDRLCALVEPAAKAARAGEGETNETFRRLELELKPLADNPTGVGLDAPLWIRRLEVEVDRMRDLFQTGPERSKRPMTDFTLAELKQQIADWKEATEEE